MNFVNIYLRPDNNKLAILWLAGGVMSLALARLYSVILLLLRAPLIISLFSNTELLKTALVVHANLSIVIWLLSVTASIWSYNLKSTYFTIACVILGFISIVLTALSPICGQNFPIINNHLPMLENIIFILGLSSFSVAILLFAIYVLLQSFLIKNNNHKNDQLIRNTIFSTSLLLLLIWGCFAISYWQIQEIIKLIAINIEFYYELLFWSGWHLSQFLYSQILIYVWLSLFQVWIGKELRFKKLYLSLLYLNLIIAITGILGHLFYNIIDSDFKEYFIPNK